MNLRPFAPCWGLEGGESHVGAVFDSGLACTYKCDVGRSPGLEDRVAGTAGEKKGLFLLTLLALSSLGAVGWFLLANVCLCVEPFSTACCHQICV